MNTVEEGVANFRDFQTEVREFIHRSDERAIGAKERDQKRSRIHFFWLALLSGLIVAGFGVILTWALNFEKRHTISEENNNHSRVQLPQTSDSR